MVLNRIDCAAAGGPSNTSRTAGERTALIQAASSGRLRACRALLQAGADAFVIDRHQQSMLDYLFYLKHSHRRRDRLASSRYSCMDLYALVNQYKLQELLTEELEDDCKKCSRCRYLLASCSPRSVQEETVELEEISGASGACMQTD